MISLETPQRKWASSILEVRTSWIFSSCGRCSRLTTVTKGTLSGGLRTGQSLFEFLGGLSRFLSLWCRSLRPCVDSVPGHEFSSPVLTCILGYFWRLPRGVSPRLERGHARALSSRTVAAVSGSRRIEHGICGFPTRISHEDFPRGFPTGLSHVPMWWESILGVKVKAVQGKQVPLEWTKTSRGLLEWSHDTKYFSPFLWRAPPLEMGRECPECFPDQAGKGSLNSSYEAEKGLLWMWAGHSCFLSSGDGYVGELLEVQQGCEKPFGLSRG